MKMMLSKKQMEKAIDCHLINDKQRHAATLFYGLKDRWEREITDIAQEAKVSSTVIRRRIWVAIKWMQFATFSLEEYEEYGQGGWFIGKLKPKGWKTRDQK